MCGIGGNAKGMAPLTMEGLSGWCEHMFRAVAARGDKCVDNVLASVQQALIRVWLPYNESVALPTLPGSGEVSDL